MEQPLGHEHCGVCGSCLLNAAQLHQCNINTLSGDIKDVYEELTDSRSQKTTRRK